ncbi:FAM184 family protein [Kipferlia bialata]|uniref:FAM184 family protein n=1 Tax=Kipferlia bialata TaxID=797122 RepID=A0A9K3CSD5_9EUKA|nr:FAM184 family protein [Kipferlia bialata]|eukprot:g2381.t1
MEAEGQVQLCRRDIDTLNQDKARLSQQKRALELRCNGLEVDVRAHANRVSELDDSLARARLQLEEERAALMSQSQQEIDRLLAEHEAELDSINREYTGAVDTLQQAAVTAREASAERERALRADIREWELRYADRESRPEDLEMVRRLRREVEEKDRMLEQAVSDMRFYKLELKNREENYNKTFSRRPNAGVMQVVKPKGRGADRGRGQGGRSSGGMTGMGGIGGEPLGMEGLPPLGSRGSGARGGDREREREMGMRERSRSDLRSGRGSKEPSPRERQSSVGSEKPKLVRFEHSTGGTGRHGGSRPGSHND